MSKQSKVKTAANNGEKMMRPTGLVCSLGSSTRDSGFPAESSASAETAFQTYKEKQAYYSSPYNKIRKLCTDHRVSSTEQDM